jgi:GxxExxY protein
MKHRELTETIIKAYYKVYNTLGYGFLEKVYENAMMIELKKQGLEPVQQKPIVVYYENEVVGDYFADILVNNQVIVELKAKAELIEKDEAQLLNYLKATDIEVGLALNFGPKPGIMRKVFDNEKKHNPDWKN